MVGIRGSPAGSQRLRRGDKNRGLGPIHPALQRGIEKMSLLIKIAVAGISLSDFWRGLLFRRASHRKNLVKERNILFYSSDCCCSLPFLQLSLFLSQYQNSSFILFQPRAILHRIVFLDPLKLKKIFLICFIISSF